MPLPSPLGPGAPVLAFDIGGTDIKGHWSTTLGTCPGCAASRRSSRTT